MDYRLALMCGEDFPLAADIKLIIHQPKLKEIALLGEEDYFAGVQTLTIGKEILAFLDKSDLEEVTNFQVFMTVMNAAEAAAKKKLVIKVLSLLFPNKQVMFTPKTIIFREEEQDNVIIDENNFDVFQKVIKDVTCSSQGKGDSFNPQGDKAKEIAAKLMRGRSRVAAQKGQENISYLSQYISVVAIAKKIPIAVVKEGTLYQLFDQIQRYNLWLAWDMDLRSRLAGGKPDKEPEDWQKNIH